MDGLMEEPEEIPVADEADNEENSDDETVEVENDLAEINAVSHSENSESEQVNED